MVVSDGLIGSVSVDPTAPMPLLISMLVASSTDHRSSEAWPDVTVLGSASKCLMTRFDSVTGALGAGDDRAAGAGGLLQAHRHATRAASAIAAICSLSGQRLTINTPLPIIRLDSDVVTTTRNVTSGVLVRRVIALWACE